MLRICPSCLSMVSGVFCTECGARLDPIPPSPRLVLRVGWSKSKDYDEVVAGLSREKGYRFMETGEDIFHEVPIEDLHHASEILSKYEKVLKWRETRLSPPRRQDVSLEPRTGAGACFVEGLLSDSFFCERNGCMHGRGLFAMDPDPRVVAAFRHLAQVETFWAMEAFVWEVMSQEELLACPKFQELVSRISQEFQVDSGDFELWPFAARVVRDSFETGVPLERWDSLPGLPEWDHMELDDPCGDGERLHLVGVSRVCITHDGLVKDGRRVWDGVVEFRDGMELEDGSILLVLESPEHGSLLLHVTDAVESAIAPGCRMLAFDPSWSRFACIREGVLVWGSVVFDGTDVFFVAEEELLASFGNVLRIDVQDDSVLVLEPERSLLWNVRAGETEWVEGGTALTPGGVWRLENLGWTVVTPDGARRRMLVRAHNIVPVGTNSMVAVGLDSGVVVFDESGEPVVAVAGPGVSGVSLSCSSLSWGQSGRRFIWKKSRNPLKLKGVFRMVIIRALAELSHEDTLLMAALVDFLDSVSPEHRDERMSEILEQAPAPVRDQLLRLISDVPLLQRALQEGDWDLGKVIGSEGT